MNRMKFAAIVFGFFSVSSQLWAAPEPTLMCPMVYRPATCSYEEYKASGTNSCFARIALQKQLKSHGVPYDSTQIRCVNSDLAARSVAKPVCGIVPTTTSCSVTVNGQQWQQSATSCDSPIPGLIQQLHDSGFEDTTGLTAVCQQSQMDIDREYAVAL
ncbi:MAG TPA: hypothetical protein VE954_00495 [Oligoflexus sp.]|uniref:hypothetical protein n=1 Tax=Oligoflexus sp. TaxID=1971216 RepID=UPI002D6B8338|nr:hypothetical protein [Oligoflexus sp.]HYX31557.1 hypothetical protein [Oligoflexus sp.]